MMVSFNQPIMDMTRCSFGWRLVCAAYLWHFIDDKKTGGGRNDGRDEDRPPGRARCAPCQPFQWLHNAEIEKLKDECTQYFNHERFVLCLYVLGALNKLQYHHANDKKRGQSQHEFKEEGSGFSQGFCSVFFR